MNTGLLYHVWKEDETIFDKNITFLDTKQNLNADLLQNVCTT